MALTRKHLDAALSDPRHLGFGFAGIQHRSSSVQTVTKVAVVRQANRLGLDFEDLFLWANSKYGRWLADSVETLGVRAKVEEFLNQKVIDRLRAERDS